jgi:hypothetical protein
MGLDDWSLEKGSKMRKNYQIAAEVPLLEILNRISMTEAS